MIDIANIENLINEIPKKYISILDYLVSAEGNVLEINKGEKDVTAPLGIYRYEHPKAAVWEYIDSIAKTVTSSASTSWDHEMCVKIDAKLDKRVCYYYAYLMYSDFYKAANLEYYDEEVVISIISLYANGPKLCNLAVQTAVNTMAKRKYIVLDNGKPLAVDGAIGSGTKSELKEIDELSSLHNYTFRLLILLAAKTEYIRIWKGDKDKYEVYLDGWNNRVDRLIAM